jgi:hypothetical protein
MKKTRIPKRMKAAARAGFLDCAKSVGSRSRNAAPRSAPTAKLTSVEIQCARTRKATKAASASDTTVPERHARSM